MGTRFKIYVFLTFLFLIRPYGPSAEEIWMPGHESGVTSIALSPKENYILSGSFDWTVRLWDFKTGKLEKTFFDQSKMIHQLGPGNIRPPDVMAVSFSTLGDLAAAGTRDRIVYVWDVKSGKEIGIFRGCEGGIRTIAFSPDSSLIAASGHEFVIRVWDIDTGNQVA